MDEERYYTVPELAELWRTSTKYVYRRLKSGELEGLCLSRTGGWRIPESAKRAYEERISNQSRLNRRGAAAKQIIS